MTLALGVFVVSLVVTLYIYAGYPALIYVVSRVRPRPIRRAGGSPPVTLIIPVHNEEAIIDAKIRNGLALTYPEDRLEMLIVSDGSTDRTEAIVERYATSDRVRLLRLPRQGKAFALNAGAAAARHDLLVFSDANSLLRPESLQHLVENFADPEVGGVCGNKAQRRPGAADTTERGEGLYWRYDKWQKHLESKIGSIFAADGTLHAVRKSLYVPMTDPSQADDIAISTRVVLQGYRLVYEPRAVAVEEAPSEGREEFRRKVRVTNHSVRALLNLRGALWSSGFYSVELVSHKLLRHYSPYFLLALFVSNVIVAGRGQAFRLILAGQVAFYALAVAGFLLRATRVGRLQPFTVPYYFSLVNLAALLGTWSVAWGVRLQAWTPRGGLGSKESR